MSTMADTPSTEEPTPRGNADAAEAEQRLEDRGDDSAAADETEAETLENLKKRVHPFD
jgi:hypothetical protein